MLNFVICDDNSVILNQISKMLESIFIKHNFEALITYQGSATLEILDYINSNHVDVLILDINFKDKITGLDIARCFKR